MSVVRAVIEKFFALPVGLQLTVGAVLISFSGVYVKLARVTPAAAGFYRMAFGAAGLLVLLAARGEIRRPPAGYLGLAFFCSFWFSVDLFCWHTSIHLIGPGLATLLANFQVFFLALIGVVFLGEHLDWKLALAVPMALGGLFLLTGVNWPRLGAIHHAGVGLGLVAAVCYTGFLVTLRRLQGAAAGASPVAALTLVTVITGVFLAVGIWRTGDTFRIPDGQSVALLAVYGIVSQMAGWVIITRALPRVSASFAGLVLLLQPSLSYVWDVLFFHKAVTPVGLAGLIITLAAIYLGSTRDRNKANRELEEV